MRSSSPSARVTSPPIEALCLSDGRQPRVECKSLIAFEHKLSGRRRRVDQQVPRMLADCARQDHKGMRSEKGIAKFLLVRADSVRESGGPASARPAAVVAHLSRDRQHQRQTYCICLGVLRLAKDGYQRDRRYEASTDSIAGRVSHTAC